MYTSVVFVGILYLLLMVPGSCNRALTALDVRDNALFADGVGQIAAAVLGSGSAPAAGTAAGPHALATQAAAQSHPPLPPREHHHGHDEQRAQQSWQAADSALGVVTAAGGDDEGDDVWM